MIQSLIPVAPPAPDVPAVPVTPVSPDKSFRNILKATVQNTSKTDSSLKASTSVNGSAKDASPPADDHSLKVSGSKHKTDKTQDSSDIDDNKVSEADQDPNEILRQIVLQMSVVAHQIANQQTPKDASATAAALASAGAQAAQPPQASQSVVSLQGIPAGQNATVPGADKQPQDEDQLARTINTAENSVTADKSGIFQIVPGAKQADGDEKINFKISDKGAVGSKDILTGSLRGASQNISSNAIAATGESDKSNADLQSFSRDGKGAAALTKAADSSGDTTLQFKIESSEGLSSNRTSGAASSPKDTGGTYAQGMQGVSVSSAHEQSSVMETVPANKLTSLDAVISKAIDSGQKNLVIRIDPPDLGSMHIRLSLDNGVLKADVRVDSSTVKDSLNMALPQIKTTLENAGIKISDFRVDVREDQYRNGQERNNQGQQQRQERGLKNGFFDFFA